MLSRLAYALVGLSLLSLPLRAFAANQVATIVTNYGKLSVALFEDAPEAVDHFKALVASKRYKGQRFYRIVAGEFVQGGIGYDRAGKEPAVPQDLGAHHRNVRGAIGFARENLLDPNSGTTEVYICVSDLPSLDDAGFEVFGQVVSGLETLDAISNVKVHKRWRYWDGKKLTTKRTDVVNRIAWHDPVDPVTIRSIYLRADTPQAAPP